MGLTTSLRTHFAIFLCLLIVGILLTIPSISAPFYWDDLHQVRAYTPQELVHTWSDGFDPDHIEDPGFRPLTMYFEHLRALAFGENTAAHRVFLLALFALFLTMLGMVARQLFATSGVQIVLGGLIGLLHVDNAYHYFWITDGIYLVPAVLIVGAILSLFQALASRRAIWLLASVVCAVLALLTREDALVVLPLLFYCGLIFVLLHRDVYLALDSKTRVWIGLYGGLLAAAFAVIWYWRHAVVPDARSLNFDPAGLLWALGQTIQDVGDYQKLARPWANYGLLILLWRIWLGSMFVMALVTAKGRARRAVLIWTGAILIAALPAMVVARVDVILLPVAFWGFVVAEILCGFWNRFRAPALRLVASGMILFAVVAPAYGSFVFQRDIRVNSLDWIATSSKLLYGFSAPVTIPPARRDAIQKVLSTYGISDLADFDVRWQRMNRQALAEGRFGANSAGLPFLPRFNFMPAYELHPCCAPLPFGP